ncbi:5791_t:CDS:2, partial [Scutellospora calospora]
AGANWKSHAKDDTTQQESDTVSYNHFWNCAKSSQNETGIMIIDEFEYWRNLQDFSEPWYKTLCHEYRHLRKEELPDGVEFGIAYKTISINVHTYLNYLLNTFTLLGGTTQRVNLSHLLECIGSETDVVINCSGIHARTLKGVEDPKVYAVRGQLVVAQFPRPQNWAFFVHGDKRPEMTYAIPRDNGEVILGGTYEEHNYSTDINYDIATGIIRRCLAVRPDLKPKDQPQLTIKEHIVGFRPCRKGGVRVDAEWTTFRESGKKVLICHNYGHGGAGK